jgi:hypothetical protein
LISRNINFFLRDLLVKNLVFFGHRFSIDDPGRIAASPSFHEIEPGVIRRQVIFTDDEWG